MIKALMHYLAVMLLASCTQAQNIIAKVNIISDKTAVTDQRIFNNLQKVITDFLNNQLWSAQNASPIERIECVLTLTINTWENSDFNASAQIQSFRPVFNTSYLSPILNMIDPNWTFKYTEGEALFINENGESHSLALLLAYYAYLIMGLDADTFALYGGDPYFSKAQNMVNNAQILASKGWKSSENQSNRYVLIDNLQDQTFRPLREFTYLYHRHGLDLFYLEMRQARNNLLDALNKLKPMVHQSIPNAYLTQVFFTTKATEISHILQRAEADRQKIAIDLLKELDPAGSPKYQSAKKRRYEIAK